MMTQNKRCLVVTTINHPNPILRELAAGAKKSGVPFFVAGDTKSPADFKLDGAVFLSIPDQERMFPEFAFLLPTRHYARKNIGYLAAMREGCEWIQETDDDNLPLEGFWEPVSSQVEVECLDHPSMWVNTYAAFSKSQIWPRGFPLDLIQSGAPNCAEKPVQVAGLIRQGLADANPDVDAIYRLAHPLPLDFQKRSPVMPAVRQWCPFNSQNTLFHKQVFTLLYLPSYCSFRMTDIWRSFVAQRCLWELGENVVFYSATVRQERNEHSLIKDFEEEIPGYLNNRAICDALEALDLSRCSLPEAQVACYEEMVAKEWLPEKELALLHSWQQSLVAQ